MSRKGGILTFLRDYMWKRPVELVGRVDVETRHFLHRDHEARQPRSCVVGIFCTSYTWSMGSVWTANTCLRVKLRYKHHHKKRPTNIYCNNTPRKMAFGHDLRGMGQRLSQLGLLLSGQRPSMPDNFLIAGLLPLVDSDLSCQNRTQKL